MALDGTRTFTVQLRDVMIADDLVLADPSDAYIRRIRAGFVLLQSGMAFGLIRGCIDLMNQTKGPLGHVNKYLDVQPEHLADQLAVMERRVEQLAMTPFESDPSYWRAVIGFDGRIFGDEPLGSLCARVTAAECRAMNRRSA